VRTVRYLGRPFAVHDAPDYVSDHLAAGERWEPSVIDAVIASAGRPGSIIDAGAMLGTHTVAWALALPGHHIHAFEPASANLPLLRANVEGLPNVTVWGCALSDRAGRRAATMDPVNRGHVAIDETDPWPMDGAREWLVSVSLDGLDIRDVRVIKADVEWHEAALLRGAAGTIARDHPVIVVEDWGGDLARPDGYGVAADWTEAHRTKMWAWT